MFLYIFRLIVLLIEYSFTDYRLKKENKMLALTYRYLDVTMIF